MRSSSTAMTDPRTRRSSAAPPGAPSLPARRGASEDRTAALIREYRATGDPEIRNRVVEENVHLADYHVRRFARSAGVSADDLHQTAMMAIIHAVERFDPDMGVSLRTFASRTIEGELKRHLRDRSWLVRPPRRLQELHLQIRRSSEELTQRLGRSVTSTELSEELDITEEQLSEGLQTEHARSPERLDAPDGTDGPGVRGDSLLGADDPGYGTAEHTVALDAAVASLGHREQQVLHLRFVEDLSQPEIAAHVGVSQSYVSRILQGSLTRLRLELAG